MPAAHNPSNGLSVILCCHNSANRLEPTLNHLARQILPEPINWEIVVIDNASTDATGLIAQQLAEHLNLKSRLRVIRETTPGLSAARRRGILECHHDLAVFCDDDNWLAPNYLALSFEILSRNPGIGVLGGCSQAASDIPLPSWFQDFAHVYAVGRLAPSSMDLTEREGFVWGAGMGVRVAPLRRLYEQHFPSLLSDRKGKELSSGGDAEICKWLIAAGYRVWLETRLSFEHYIPPQRLEKSYLKGILKGWTSSGCALNHYQAYLQSTFLKAHNSSTLKRWRHQIYLLRKHRSFRRHWRLLLRCLGDCRLDPQALEIQQLS